ncbi:MAG: hypothetical protein KH897_18410 [Bacteroides sp.]|uniref:hypothetical protein n=1 Tax=Bacteroides sp. TaxID=29523 RepID=UPI0025C5EE2D|nr:hypothetical protein [Bacteroides sp.]MBS6240288.1 hypothetical protein [Bacteroides sp.]
MANWLSVSLAAEKYGISKEQIHEWIRLGYLRCSSLDKDPYEDPDPMVDAEDLEKSLEFNSTKSYPEDDATIERVPKEHLNWLYKENARLTKVNDDLYEENYRRAQREARLQEGFEKMSDLTHRILSLNEKILNNDRKMKGGKTSAWSFLCRLFRKES